MEHKTIARYENKGLCSLVVQESQNKFVVVCNENKFCFDNSYNAFLKAREIVGKDNFHYQPK
jgi:hypothetical protein